MRFFFLSLLITVCFQALGQTSLWTEIVDPAFRNSSNERLISPENYRLFHLDLVALESILNQAPDRLNPSDNRATIALPMPDGNFQQFAIENAALLHPQLARKFPEIRTFTGRGIDEPSSAVYLDWTLHGFHALVLSPGKMIFIDPVFKNDREHYAIYDKADFAPADLSSFSCGTQTQGRGYVPSAGMTPATGNRNAAVTLRTYRLAVAANGEYTAYHGGTKAGALSAITTTINRVRGIYETELAISFTIIANNDDIIYTDAATDPYSNPPALAQNQTNIDNVILPANYDFGHVMGTGGTGGIATLGVVCVNGYKARGVTALNHPVGDPFNVDFVAHEIGHQFGANHTFNGTNGSCGGASRNAATAYEPGSGSSIMAYAGICGSDNLQYRSDAYFHSVSLDEIKTYVTSGDGSTCPAQTGTGNNTPTVDADPNGVGGKYIPHSTPFELIAAGSDPDGGTLTFNWEQWDLGSAGMPTATQTTGPVFRSFPPNASPSRTFPCLSNILENTGSTGEVLPSVSRDLNFKCTVRDNNAGGGGSAVGSLQLHVTNTAGPFAIFSHNTTADVNGSITLLWNVANTTSAPVNCASVDILLSTDGGQTFSMLLAGTPNDGSQAVNLPNTPTAQARIKVKCSDNVFFDINNADLRIVPGGASCNELFTNSNMENSAGWTEYSSNFGTGLIDDWTSSGVEAHSGTSCAWLGFVNNEVSRISQTVAIPADAHFANLEFWYKIDEFDCGADVLNLKVNNVIIHLYPLCSEEAAAGWTRQIVDLSAYKGASPTIMFECLTNGTHPSNVFIDDVSLYVCQGGAFAPLPVELTDFRARAEGNDALLTWTTASETSNAGFEVEMRSENTDFQSVGFVKGAGNSPLPTHYRHLVPNLQPGVHYFRLRQIDQDGASTLSPVRAVTIAGETHLTVQPNPVNGMAGFVLLLDREEQIRLEVLDAMGRPVGLVADDHFTQGKFDLRFNCGHLPAGIYFYRLTGKNFEETGRFSVVK